MKNRTLVAKFLGVSVFVVTLISQNVYLKDSALDLILELCGFSFLTISAFGRTWASAFISGKKSKDLVIDGPYSMVRNPLYFFSLFGFIGAGLAFESLTITCLFCFIFFFTHWPTIIREERHLSELFGDTYDTYKNRVPRIIPNPWLLKNPESVLISSVIFTKALIESSLILFVFILAHIVEWSHFHSLLPVFFKLY